MKYGMARLAVEAETSPKRFERFANGVVGLVEPGIVLITSASWDLGRDGVGAGAAKGAFVLSSLRKDVGLKAISDVEELASHTKRIRKVYFCSAQSMSEHAIQSVEDALSQALLDLDVEHEDVTVLDAAKLVQIDIDHNDAELLRRYYHAEIDDLVHTFYSDSHESGRETLQLSFIAMEADSLTDMRARAYRSAVLHSLAMLDGSGTAQGIAKEASDSLKLGRSIGKAPVRLALQELEQGGFVQREASEGNELWSLTASGHDEDAEVTARGASNVLALKNGVREHLEEEVGRPIGGRTFEQLWAALRDKLLALLYERGKAIVDWMLTLLGEQNGAPILDHYNDLVDELASVAGGLTSNEDAADEYRDALRDMFSRTDGPAAEWLMRACAGYVTVCAMGLESRTSREISDAIKRIHVVVDTDVLISLLCEGEPNHAVIRDVCREWVGAGGHALVSHVTMSEVAHHAAIAKYDFENTREWLPGSEEDAERLVSNAFVRTFAHYLRQGKVRRVDRWYSFIGEYQGESRRDYSKIWEFARDDLKLEELLPVEEAARAVQRRVFQALTNGEDRRSVGRTGVWSGDIRVDKAQRDAQLVAQVFQHRERVARASSGATCCLVSSSGRLESVAGQLDGKQNAGVPLVVPPPAWVYLMSLMPGVSMGLSAMKTFIFDGHASAGMDGLDLAVLRALYKSDVVEVPWAKRNVLKRKLRGAIVSRAKRMGVAPAEVERIAATPEGGEEQRRVLAEVVSAVVDEAALPSPVKAELSEARGALERKDQEIERLKRELARARKRRD